MFQWSILAAHPVVLCWRRLSRVSRGVRRRARRRMNARLGFVEPLVDPDRLAAWMDTQGLEPGAPIAVDAHHNRTLERGLPRDSRRAHSSCCDARRARRCRRPRTTWRASSDCCAHSSGAPTFPCRNRSRVASDRDVLGVPFYLMAPVDGVVVRERVPEVIAADSSPRACAYALVDALAGIHAFDWRAGWPRGFREARRLPRTAGAALARPARALPDPAAAGGRRGRCVGCRRTRR